MSRWRPLVFLAFLAGCCGGTLPSLEPYTGPRDGAALSAELSRRHGWDSLAATGSGLFTSASGEGTSLRYEICLDRRSGCLAFTADKLLAGTLFRLVVTSREAVMDDFTGEDPVSTRLDGSKPIDILGGGTVEDLRALLLAWPPRGEPESRGSDLAWGCFLFDSQTLELKGFRHGDLEGRFEGAVAGPSGRALPVRWVFGARGSEHLRLDFDADAEVDVPLEKSLFEIPPRGS